MSIYELIMLVCFGAAWPFSIYRSYKSGSVAGKSLPFLVIVMVGYVSGIIHKLTHNMDVVLYAYILNLVMVLLDTLLYLKNKRNLGKAAGK